MSLSQGNPSTFTIPRSNSGHRRSVLWRALAVCAAVGVGLPALAASAQAAPRTVTGNVVFRIMDYENFGSNERCNREVRLTPRAIEVGSTTRIRVTAACGGEIRVEVTYALQQQEGGFIRVTEGLVNFYEGESSNTNDLDGSSAFGDMFLWPGQSGVRNIHVENWAEGEPDDKADVALTLRN
ncbi:hypothetical protein ACWEKT_08885 [Nocardia takedensis]